MLDSADHEARWVKKGKDAFFGYRGYSAVDTEDGYVEHVEVHPANQAEVMQNTTEHYRTAVGWKG